MRSLLLGIAAIAMATTVMAENHEVYSMNYPTDKTEVLSACKGTAQLVKRDGNLYVKVQDAASCSNILIQEADGDMKKIGKLEGGKGVEYIALNEKIGHNHFVVKAMSNSGKTSATLNISSFVAPPAPKVAQISPYTPADFVLSTYLFGRRMASLADCGGTVYLYKDISGRARLSFQNVQKCSNFDILTTNGEYSKYKEQKIGTEGNRSEDIVIPFNQTEFGGNEIKIVVKSNSAKTYDVFKIQFFAW